jgi:hypothetical protein
MALPQNPCSVNPDCIKYFACKPLEAPEPGLIFTPYVAMAFGGTVNKAVLLSVGNNSSPSANLAAIKSFSYGLSGGTGAGVEMEIVDNGGALYKDIIRNLNKKVDTRADEIKTVSIDYGWLITKPIEQGGTGIPRLYSAGNPYGQIIRLLLKECETSFSNGNVVLKVKLTPPEVQDVAITRSEGDEDAPADLKEAITNLLTRRDVGYSDVYFRSSDSVDDETVTDDLEFKKSDGGKDGPKSVWPTNQMNALAVCRQWLMSFTSVNGRGLLMVYDSNKNVMIIQEDPVNPQGKENCCDTCVATYVVNGGGCSPVIEFNPSINWPMGSIPGRGGTAGGASGSTQPTLDPQDVEKVGSQTSPVIEQHVWNFRPPEDQAEEANDATIANLKTQQTSNGGLTGAGAGTGLTAELKILGDPFYTNGATLVAKSVSIVFINPFFIANSSDKNIKGPVWLQTSNCSTILSNKKYIIVGVAHNISNGTFTTTLSLRLPAPNLDLPMDSGYGGDGCGSLSELPIDDDDTF